VAILVVCSLGVLLIQLQYFLALYYMDNINKHIEKAILKADAMGVKVLSLAALNKVNLFLAPI
jgi:hypothetical protein